MIKGMVTSLVILLGISAFASNPIMNVVNVNELQQATMAQVGPFGLDWKIGEAIDYSLDMGFIQGKMRMEVKTENNEGFWVHQDVDLGFMGQQKIEILFSKVDGRVLKIIANGQEQQLPDPNNMEIVEMKESNVTVPAGTFDCIYARIRDKQQNQESEAWINPSIVPISGMIKTIAPSQFGKITIVMTGFNDL